MVTYYLTKTLTTGGNSAGFSGTNIQFSLDSALVKVVEKMDKKYGANIQRPYSTGSFAIKAPTTILVDLKQIVWSFTVTGSLSNDSGNITGVSPATANTAINKKRLLQAFAEQGGTMTFGHRNDPNSFSVNIISLEFTDIQTEVGSDETTIMKDNEERVSFILVLQRGIDRGST